MTTQPSRETQAAISYERLRVAIERECTECDGAIVRQQTEKTEYVTLKARLQELQQQIEHPIMVPFGSVGFMTGRLVRTNEVMVLLGENYFVDRSVHQTCEIIDRRIKCLESEIAKLQEQKRNALNRLDFAQGLFGKKEVRGDNEEVEIREEYDEEKELEMQRMRRERAAAARKEATMPLKDYKAVQARLDALEERERRDGELEEKEEDEEEECQTPITLPKGVSKEEYKKLLARLDQLDDEEEEEEEGTAEELDSDDTEGLSDDDEKKLIGRENGRMSAEYVDSDDSVSTSSPPPRASNDKVLKRPKTLPTQKMTVVDSKHVENVRGGEEKRGEEEDNKTTEGNENTPQGTCNNNNHDNTKKGLTHKRSVRFKKNLEAGPASPNKVLEEPTPVQEVPARSILRNKAEESPIDHVAFSEMEDQRQSTILAAGDAFSGCIVERNVESLPNAIVFKPVDEPPRRVSRFRLQRMQLATE